jgi:excisionase family DNA binding protein
MKVEITLPPELVGKIAEMVVDKMNLLLSNRQDNQDDTIFDVEGIADYLKMKKQWVYERVHYNTIPNYKLGKYPRFRKSEIDQWLKTMERGKGRITTKTVRRLLEEAP